MSKNESRALATVGKVSDLRAMLDSPAMQEQLLAALPKHLTPDRIIRTAITAVQKNPRLLECSKRSVIGAIVEASQLGLEIDDGRGLAYLVPYWNKHTKSFEAQMIPGYKGLVDLAYRSQRVKIIQPRAIYSNDDYDVVFGLEEDIKHKPAIFAEDRGEFLGAYAWALMDDGSKTFAVMSKSQIDKHRARSKASDSGPWVTDYEEMALKTVIKQLAKTLPQSIEDLQKAIGHDDEIERGMVKVYDDYDPVFGAPAQSKLENLTQRIQGKAADPEPETEPQPESEPPQEPADDAQAAELFPEGAKEAQEAQATTEPPEKPKAKSKPAAPKPKAKPDSTPPKWDRKAAEKQIMDAATAMEPEEWDEVIDSLELTSKKGLADMTDQDIQNILARIDQ